MVSVAPHVTVRFNDLCAGFHDARQKLSRHGVRASHYVLEERPKVTVIETSSNGKKRTVFDISKTPVYRRLDKKDNLPFLSDVISHTRQVVTFVRCFLQQYDFSFTEFIDFKPEGESYWVRKS